MLDALRVARLSGSSIAKPVASWWVTDFLNAAFHARSAAERDVDDLRLAFGILTTRWQRNGGRRLGATDVAAYHRAFGPARLRGGGRLSRTALMAGARRLVGDWFEDAWADDARRAHGIAFPTVEGRVSFDPSARVRGTALGPITPPAAPDAERHWATYDPVALPDPAAALAFLLEPARWPDMGCAGGRFTALRRGGLLGQTFEIEVNAEPLPRAPVYTRAYVTCTGLFERGDELHARVAEVAALLRAHGRRAEAMPEGSRALGLVELTTHEGHFLGRAVSRLLVYEAGRGEAFVRDIGCWDPLRWHLATAYATTGRRAQEDFWGPQAPERSMLVQLALVSAARA